MGEERFVILPDVTCELNASIREEYGIDVILGHISYPDGTEGDAILDWKDCPFLKEHTGEEFYTELGKNPSGFTTAPPNIQEFYNAFEKYVKEGVGVLSMTISSGMSGTYNFSKKAKEMILEKYPDAKIECFDSLRFGPGYGLMAIYASVLRSEGKTLSEVKDYLEKNKSRFHQAGWLDDLSFVAKKGRISHAKAFMGKLIGVKPLGEFEQTGMTTVIGKAKGEKSAYRAMLSYIESTVTDPSEQIMIIAHTNRRAQAEYFKQMVEEKFHPKKIYLNDVYPSCGINIGPGLMAAYYVGKEISEDLSSEKALMAKILSEN